MSEYITKIRTNTGDKQIDYNALANLPQIDNTLTTSGAPADAKIVGDKISALETSKADKTYVEAEIKKAQEDTTVIDEKLVAKADITYVDEQLATKADKSDVDTAIENIQGDKTLTVDGAFADAKVVGEKISALEENKADKTVVDQIISLPASTEQDNRKFLRVVNGVASWEVVPDAEELVF